MLRLTLLFPLALAACDEPVAPAAPADAPTETAAPATPAPEPMANRDDAVKKALEVALDESDDPVPDLSNVLIGYSDLDGSGAEEALVWLRAPGWCGTGGCPLYVLQFAPEAWHVTDQISVTRPPVYKLAPGADGWAELGISVGGGGMKAAVMAVPHGEDGYASNPTVAPARPVDPGVAPILIDEPPLP